MLTGRRLFDGPTPQELIARLLHDSLPDLGAVDPAAPAALRAIVARCVDRQPARRFAAATDLAMALRALLTNTSEATGTRRPRPRGKSLAVIPFANTVKDPQIEYLIDGITESIINSLSQLPGLRVVPRSLVFRYKGLQTDPSTVGLALNARTILTGHIVQQGDLLHIQAELVDTATESQLWGERFRHKTSELLAMQEEIAWQISEALRLKLSGEHKKRLKRRPTVNNDAYQEYMRGRHCWHQWAPHNFLRAIEHFERALSFDPEYALAYTGLGNAYAALAYYGVIRPEEGFPKARAAAERALAIDDRLAEAHVVIAEERLFYGWDPPAAFQAVDEALRMDPESAVGYAVKSLILVSMHRFDEALKSARHARALDPLSPFINMGVAWVFHFWGRPADAVRELQDVLAFRPGLDEAGNILITSYESLGRFEEAAALMQKQSCWGIHLDGAAVATAFRRGGPEAYWRERLVQMRKGGEAPAFAGFSFATVHCHLGEFDLAVDYLERMVEGHAGGTVFIAVENTIGRLKGFPRYDALLNRIGASRWQTASTPHTASP
jgi:TolB-like protein